MDAYFFRVDHDLLKSESFKGLGGSAIKVYLVIGLYSDFGTGWAFPSIRTIARQAGLSRQTVLTALEDLARCGLVATSKSRGKSNAYRIIRQAPLRPAARRTKASMNHKGGGPDSLYVSRSTVLRSLDASHPTVLFSLEEEAQSLDRTGPTVSPKQETTNETEDSNTSVPIPGTPFRLSAEGRLHIAVDLQQLLTGEGLPRKTAARLLAQKDPEAVAKVLLNAFYLRSQGKLQNGPGYIRAGIEEGYELLPQVATHLESRRRELESRLRSAEGRTQRTQEHEAQAEEEAAIQLVIERLRPTELQGLIKQAVAALPKPLVQRNPTLSNPFIRAKVYELAGGEPVS